MKHQPNFHNSPDGGFTLIEILISMLLLSIVILGTTAMQVVAIRSNQKSAAMLVASTLAQSRIEKFFADPMPAANFQETLGNSCNGGAENCCFKYDGQPEACSEEFFFQREVTVTQNGVGFDINVVITWQDAETSRNLTLAAFKNP